ncbi:hypothetical protein DFS34DRAFT_635241 [Phlyctochytrium arcticum]|nr:hypothetical protein DFS34DRAFT_635241 [Phlyctochytrium arcticum]
MVSAEVRDDIPPPLPINGKISLGTVKSPSIVVNDDEEPRVTILSTSEPAPNLAGYCIRRKLSVATSSTANQKYMRSEDTIDMIPSPLVIASPVIPAFQISVATPITGTDTERDSPAELRAHVPSVSVSNENRRSSVRVSDAGSLSEESFIAGYMKSPSTAGSPPLAFPPFRDIGRDLQIETAAGDTQTSSLSSAQSTRSSIASDDLPLSYLVPAEPAPDDVPIVLDSLAGGMIGISNGEVNAALAEVPQHQGQVLQEANGPISVDASVQTHTNPIFRIVPPVITPPPLSGPELSREKPLPNFPPIDVQRSISLGPTFDGYSNTAGLATALNPPMTHAPRTSSAMPLNPARSHPDLRNLLQNTSVQMNPLPSSQLATSSLAIYPNAVLDTGSRPGPPTRSTSAGLLPGRSEVEIPVRAASRMPISNMWSQPQPAAPSPRLGGRNSLFKKRLSQMTTDAVDLGAVVENGNGIGAVARPLEVATMVAGGPSTTSTPNSTVSSASDTAGSSPSSWQTVTPVTSPQRSQIGEPSSSPLNERDHAAQQINDVSSHKPVTLVQLPAGTVHITPSPNYTIAVPPRPAARTNGLYALPEQIFVPQAGGGALVVEDSVSAANSSLKQVQLQSATSLRQLKVPNVVLPFMGKVVRRRSSNRRRRQATAAAVALEGPAGSSTVVIAPRISSLFGSTGRQEIARRRFTYLGGDNLIIPGLSPPVEHTEGGEANPAPFPTNPLATLQRIVNQRRSLDPRDIVSCPLCADVCERAVRLVCCDTIACSPCIWRWLAHSKSCPFCRSWIEPTHVNPAIDVQEIVNRLVVRCKEGGCNWSGPKGDLRGHIAAGACSAPIHAAQTERGRASFEYATTNDFAKMGISSEAHMAEAKADGSVAVSQSQIVAMDPVNLPHPAGLLPSHHTRPIIIVPPRRSPSTRILIPLRSAHPHVLFKRMSGGGGFIRFDPTAPVGIPPRTTSAGLDSVLLAAMERELKAGGDAVTAANAVAAIAANRLESGALSTRDIAASAARAISRSNLPAPEMATLEAQLTLAAATYSTNPSTLSRRRSIRSNRSSYRHVPPGPYIDLASRRRRRISDTPACSHIIGGTSWDDIDDAPTFDHPTRPWSISSRRAGSRTTSVSSLAGVLWDVDEQDLVVQPDQQLDVDAWSDVQEGELDDVKEEDEPEGQTVSGLKPRQPLSAFLSPSPVSTGFSQPLPIPSSPGLGPIMESAVDMLGTSPGTGGLLDTRSEPL